MTEPAWLTKARSYIGFHEQGNNQGIGEFISLAHTGELGQPWCAIFANACLESSGVKGTRSPAAHSFADSSDFTGIDPPRVGAISVFTRVGGNHVGFYTGEDSRGLLILGGNQGDSVCIEHHTRSGLVGFYWPKDVAVAAADTGGSSGRGSWYSQHPPDWHDSGDKPGSNALGVPDECQGVSFYNHSTLGHWFSVTAPNGVTSIEQQTDIGPNPNTGRQIDISAVCAAERFHYSKHDFPTDGIFRWHSVPAPAAVAGLSPQQQADAYHHIRKDIAIMADTQPQQPPYQAPAIPAMPQFDLAGIINAIQSKQAYARDSILSIVGIYNALNPASKILLASDAPAATQPPPAAPAPTVAQPAASPFGQILASLGGGSNLSFWTGIAAAFGHILLTHVGVVGAPTGAAATTAGTLLATGAGSATLAGIFTKLGSIAKLLGPLAAIIPK